MAASERYAPAQVHAGIEPFLSALH